MNDLIDPLNDLIECAMHTLEKLDLAGFSKDDDGNDYEDIAQLRASVEKAFLAAQKYESEISLMLSELNKEGPKEHAE